MNLLSDILTYIRRIIKSPSNAVITDNLLIDYVNRFWLMDMDARVQLFDFKTTYQFQTTPGIDQYNMPLYSVQTQPDGSQIAPFPVYQGFFSVATCNGINIPLYTSQQDFFNIWPNYVQQVIPAATGNGGAAYTFTLPFLPLLPGHVDMGGIIATWPGNTADPILDTTLNLNVPVANVQAAVYLTATGPNGQNIFVSDSGQFLSNNTDGDLYGLLMAPGQAPLGNAALVGGYSTTSNTINYNTGVINVTFPANIPSGNSIQAQVFNFQQGLPRAVLFYNNVLTFRSPPDKAYFIKLEGYLTPAAFLSTSQAAQFGYMCEYIARGAARKILADTGDIEQFQFYEPLFREQETLVWKRSQRQFTATRTQTIYSAPYQQSNYNQTATGV